MARVHDVGGMEGFGAVDPAEPAEVFETEWEARVWAMNAVLLGTGAYGPDELRDAIERMPPAAYLAASYYERWFRAICTLAAEKGLVEPHELAAALETGGDG